MIPSRSVMMTNLAPGPRSLHQGDMTTIGWHSYNHVLLGCILFEPVPSMPRVACLSVGLCMPDTENMMPIMRAAGPHTEGCTELYIPKLRGSCLLHEQMNENAHVCNSSASCLMGCSQANTETHRQTDGQAAVTQYMSAGCSIELERVRATCKYSKLYTDFDASGHECTDTERQHCLKQATHFPSR